jgi:hypothetical protein
MVWNSFEREFLLLIHRNNRYNCETLNDPKEIPEMLLLWYYWHRLPLLLLLWNDLKGNAFHRESPILRLLLEKLLYELLRQYMIVVVSDGVHIVREFETCHLHSTMTAGGAGTPR